MTNGPRNRRRLLSRTLGIAVTGCLLIAVLLLTLWLVSLADATQAQRRTRRQTRSPSPTKAIDYSKFSHATKEHQAACHTCHMSPTKNWQQVRNFPDVTDYPDHDACVRCHRRQFFQGARPVICTICHVKVSPRDEARLAFRNPVAQRQFTIEFPHDKHQDVIAQLKSPINSGGRFGFVRASFQVRAPDDKTKTYNNCTICHESRKQNPLPPPSGWIDSFAPAAATFKSVPSSHASCFNCHWKSQSPVNHDCAGCHKLAKPYASMDLVKRLSMKFRHGREQHVLECTACHINITKALSLRGLTPDVPITSCTECHNKVGLRGDLDAELAKLDKDKNLVCTYCHTSDKGKLDPPASHYLIAGRKPIKRAEMR
jgi:hypothetical protein